VAVKKSHANADISYWQQMFPIGNMCQIAYVVLSAVCLGFPALGGLFVAVSRFNPALAFFCEFFFPKGRLGFEIVHDKFTGGEGVASMGAINANKNYLIAWMHGANAMYYSGVNDAPARFCCVDYGRSRFLGHAGIVF
jgi:hypothetical protein